ncbi:hypothetical protein DFH09DRAFT_1320151 [Mycena vulgaris]|nr:hypothetical protein DFH09DRAFT_1320151 [Mycena vulgaris]
MTSMYLTHPGLAAFDVRSRRTARKPTVSVKFGLLWDYGVRMSATVNLIAASLYSSYPRSLAPPAPFNLRAPPSCLSVTSPFEYNCVRVLDTLVASRACGSISVTFPIARP